MKAAHVLADETNNTAATDSRPRRLSDCRRSPSETFNSFIQKMTNMSEDEQNREIKFSSLGLEDKMSMFTIHQDYTRGSVSAARGRKVTILPSKFVATERRERVSKVVSMASKQCQRAAQDRKAGLFIKGIAKYM